MNKIIIMGNLGKDAELKIVGETAVLKWTLAVTETWKKDGEKKEKTNWFNVELWGTRAKSLAQYLTKGTKLLVEGSVDFQTYEKDGEKKYFTVVKALNVEFAGGGAKGESKSSSSNHDDSDGDLGGSLGDDEIPF